MAKQPNYLAKLLELEVNGGISLTPGVHHIYVSHDDWCSIYKGGSCDCEPDVKTEKARTR